MVMNETVSLKNLMYAFFGCGALALAIVAAVWAILGIFVL